MRCSGCGYVGHGGERFCRRCGAPVDGAALVPAGRRLSARADGELRPVAAPSDPDELVGSGIAKVIAGDGFFFVGVLLATAQTPVGGLLWLLLLLPAFYLFGLGFSDVFKARQIRRREKARDLLAGEQYREIAPPSVSIADVLSGDTTRKLHSGSGGISTD